MKHSLKIALPSLMLSIAFSSHAAESLKPTAVADLYIRTLVNHDEQAISQLNDYLRADRLRSGRSADYASAADLKAADKAFPGEIADMAMPLFPEAVRGSLKAPLIELMTTVQKARQSSQCKAVSAGEAQKDDNGILTTEVAFSCTLVKTNESWANGIHRIAQSNCDAAQCTSELKKLQATYTAPASFEYKGTFAISMVPQDKDTAWRNDFARETFDEMFSDL